MTFGWSYTMGAACPVIMKMIILILWLNSGPAQTSIIQQNLWYKPHPKTWTDARATCKSEHNGDLPMATATLTVNLLNQMDMTKYYAWIGLRRSGSTWNWDKGTEEVPVQSIFSVPDGQKECGLGLYNEYKPLDDDCKNLHFFYCRNPDYYYYYYNYDIFVPQTKTWEGAKSYCVKHGYEFIAITFDNDLHYTGSPFYNIRNFPVWIGQYQNDDCGVIWSQNKTWSYQNCSEALPFLCSSNNLRLVQDLLTWEQSYHHCKSHAPSNYRSYQLVSGDTLDLQFIQFVASNATTDKVWLGLRFIGGSWFWSDGATVSLPDLPSCPEPNLHCGALVVNRHSSTSTPTIELSDCSLKLNLICYGL